MDPRKTRIITFTGRGGTGKTSIVDRLLSYEDLFCPIRGVSTRPVRPSDRVWENHQIGEEEFERLQREGLLIMQAGLASYRYAVRKDCVDEALSGDRIGVRILSLNTVALFHEYVSSIAGRGAVRSFYIKASDPAVLFQRMVARGDNVDVVRMRTRLENTMDDEVRYLTETYARNYNGEPLFHAIINNDNNIEMAIANVLQNVWT